MLHQAFRYKIRCRYLSKMFFLLASLCKYTLHCPTIIKIYESNFIENRFKCIKHENNEVIIKEQIYQYTKFNDRKIKCTYNNTQPVLLYYLVMVKKILIFVMRRRRGYFFFSLVTYLSQAMTLYDSFYSIA